LRQGRRPDHRRRVLQEGFIGSGQIKVDSKKVKAETLDGRYCSRNKCKVFEQIICANN
jgi:hypothetical protein